MAFTGLQSTVPGGNVLSQITGQPTPITQSGFTQLVNTPAPTQNNNGGGAVVNNGAVAAGGSVGGSTYNPAIANAINQNYQQQQLGYQHQLDLLDPNYQTNTGNVNASYGQQNKQLQDQYNSGLQSNNLANAQLDTSRTNTLRDLTHQMQGMIQGYGNQLGTYGAGDSSATGLINYALTNQGNRSINDANQQAAYQQTGLNNQKDSLQQQYNDQSDALNRWRDQSLSALAQAYTQYKATFEDAINGSKTAQSQILAQYGAHPDATLANALTNLDKTYGTAQQRLASAYNNVAPNSDLSKYSTFATTPITQQQLQGANFAPVQTNPVNAPVSIKRTTDQTQQGL